MTDTDKIVERVRKLLAMSEDTSSPHEAAIAAKRAAHLMQQYNIDNAAVLLNTLSDDDIVENTVDSAQGKRIARWIMLLLVPVADLHDCKVRYVRGATGLKVPQFIGTTEDAMVAGYVFEYLVREIKWLAKLYQPLNKLLKGGMAGMNDFKDGASSTVRDMLREMRKAKEAAEQQVNADNSRALVICKKQLIESRYSIKYTRGGSRSYRNSEARASGERAGAGVTIRDAITGSGSRTALIT